MVNVMVSSLLWFPRFLRENLESTRKRRAKSTSLLEGSCLVLSQMLTTRDLTRQEWDLLLRTITASVSVGSDVVTSFTAIVKGLLMVRLASTSPTFSVLLDCWQLIVALQLASLGQHTCPFYFSLSTLVY